MAEPKRIPIPIGGEPFAITHSCLIIPQWFLAHTYRRPWSFCLLCHFCIFHNIDRVIIRHTTVSAVFYFYTKLEVKLLLQDLQMWTISERHLTWTSRKDGKIYQLPNSVFIYITSWDMMSFPPRQNFNLYSKMWRPLWTYKLYN